MATERRPLSYECGPGAPALLETTIGANLADTATTFGSRDALVDVAAGRRWSYADFVADVRRLAMGLLRGGVGAGDRVGIWAPNRWE